MRTNRNPVTNGAFATALVLALFYVSIGSLDPFGLKKAASLQSEAVFNRLVSGPWYESNAQNKITVVLVDDAFVAQHREQWPLSYTTQDWLLASIMSYGPKAIYLDFLYRQRHHINEPIEQFGDSLDSISQKIPLFIPMLVDATRSPGSCGDSSGRKLADSQDVVDIKSVIPEIQKTKTTKTYIGWDDCGERYPALLYGNENLATPAFALYKAVCESDPDFSHTCKDAQNAQNFKDPMIVVWGTGVSPLHQSVAKASGAECTSINKGSVFSKLGYQLNQLYQMLLNLRPKTLNGNEIERCAYTDTLPAMWLSTTREPAKENIRALLKDRVVLIGAKIDGVPDFITSPVNGTLPGVYLFGMALDNYLEYGAEHYRHDGRRGGIWVEAFVFFLIYLVSSSSWRWVVASKYPERATNYSLLDVNAVGWFFIVFRVLLPMATAVFIPIIFWYIGRIPMDWISLVGMSFLLTPVVISDCFQDRVATVLWHGLKDVRTQIVGRFFEFFR